MSSKKTGIVFLDVGWHRRTGERYGFPPSDEPEVNACWNVEDEANSAHPLVEIGFDDVDEAVEWARERAPLVLVRLGPTEDVMFSAGERRATRELPEFGGTDLTPYPEWPPPDWPNTPLPPLPPAKESGDILVLLGEEVSEDDFEIGDALAEQRERYGVGWFDNVRIRATPQTERLGFAGLAGQVFGETMPSEGEIKGETVVGELEADYALYVDFGEDREGAWFAPQLVEFVDHSRGAELEVGGAKMVRDERGEWHERKRPGLMRRFLERFR